MNDQFEEDLAYFYHTGERPDSSQISTQCAIGVLSDVQRLNLFAALLRMNNALSPKDLAVGHYGEIGNSMAGYLMELEGRIGLMKRGLELAKGDMNASQAITSMHQQIGEMVMEAFTSLKSDSFVEIAKVIESRLARTPSQTVTLSKKLHTRPRTPYILDIVFPAALQTVTFRRSLHLGGV